MCVCKEDGAGRERERGLGLGLVRACHGRLCRLLRFRVRGLHTGVMDRGTCLFSVWSFAVFSPVFFFFLFPNVPLRTTPLTQTQALNRSTLHWTLA